MTVSVSSPSSASVSFASDVSAVDGRCPRRSWPRRRRPSGGVVRPALTVIVTVAVSVPPLPSETVYVNVSVPLKFAARRGGQPGAVAGDRRPCRVSRPASTAVIASVLAGVASRSVSLASTSTRTAVSSLTVAGVVVRVRARRSTGVDGDRDRGRVGAAVAVGDRVGERVGAVKFGVRRVDELVVAARPTVSLSSRPVPLAPGRPSGCVSVSPSGVGVVGQHVDGDAPVSSSVVAASSLGRPGRRSPA